MTMEKAILPGASPVIKELYDNDGHKTIEKPENWSVLKAIDQLNWLNTWLENSRRDEYSTLQLKAALETVDLDSIDVSTEEGQRLKKWAMSILKK